MRIGSRQNCWVLLLAVWACLISACAPVPPPLDHSRDPRLVEVQALFARTVSDITKRDDQQWQRGWTGNMAVHLSGKRWRGLCYQWQGEVYRLITPGVRQLGLETIGVTLDRGKMTEHHAVLVFDPMAVPDALAIPAMPPPRPGWVLDAWARGKPDIYLLDDWVQAHGARRRLEVRRVLGDDLKPIEVP